MSLPYRLTAVGWMNMNTLSHASSIQFGDTRDKVTLFNRVLAIQRAIAKFEGDEMRFASYPLFLLPKPVPLVPPPARIVNIRHFNHVGTTADFADRLMQPV